LEIFLIQRKSIQLLHSTYSQQDFQPRCFGDRHVQNEILAEAIRGGDQPAGREPGPQDLAHAADVHYEALEATREKVRYRLMDRHLESLERGNKREFAADDLVLLAIHYTHFFHIQFNDSITRTSPRITEERFATLHRD
jgi:hypothetical protein